MPPLLVTYSIKISGTTHRVTHGDNSFLVAPVVIVKAGVLNHELLPAHELELFPAMWDGIPLTLRHPLNNESANVPEPNIPILGQLFGSQWNAADQKIVSEAWFADDLVNATEDGKAAVDRIEAGEIMNVSTGYYRVAIEKPGIFGGKSYLRVQSDIKPDHLAILPDELGSCSTEDGCGIPRANKKDADACDGVSILSIFSKESPMNDFVKVVLNALTGAGLITMQDGDEDDLPVVTPVPDPAPAAAAPVADPAADPVGDPPTADGGDGDELAALVDEFGGIDGIRQILGDAKAAGSVAQSAAVTEKAARDVVIARLAENDRCTISAEDLSLMSLDGLEAVEQTFGIATDFGALGQRLPANNANLTVNAPPAAVLATVAKD